jgi:uncharacterized protein (TIGR00725 family)
MRRPIVGVMGSSTERYDGLCQRLAREIKGVKAWLLTGGGGGVMASIAEHYKRVYPDGLVIGILPARADRPGEAPDGYPNEWVDIAIQTHLHLRGPRGGDVLSRNHINILSATAIVALPGGDGTRSEVSLSVAYGKPVIVYHEPENALSHIPSSVEQTSDIEKVSAFLQRYIK